MKRPRISTVVIVLQSVLLLASLGFLGFFISQDWVSYIAAKDFAYQAGSESARRSYVRGEYSIYEMKLYAYDDNYSGPVPYEGMTVPSGKQEGRFAVDYFLVSKGLFFKQYQDIQQSFIDGYNGQMRAYFDSPELWDKSGSRIPMRELHSRTNTLNSVK